MTRACDLAIVGGGIHGVGVAQRAAAAGHSVLLLEKERLAAGTSSRSSKLIHGGLRYLESGELRLVRESLHERTALLRLAPELVRLQRFYIPVYADTRRRPWVLAAGLTLYAGLAGFARGASFGLVPRHAWDTLDGLSTARLERVFWYHDGQTDDAALTRAVMASAERLGAELASPATFIGAELRDDGAVVRYSQRGGVVECLARVLVNAAGPWAPQVARLISPASALPDVELVQGTHLVLEAPPPARGIYYVESPRDGRAIFVMPWRGAAMIGTTEVRFRGNPDEVSASVGETHYLRGVLRRYFPAMAAAHGSGRAFAGLRVLPGGTGHAFHRSRETMYTVDRARKPRVVSIYGGKLTTFRATAAEALKRVAASLPARRPRADVDRVPLPPA
ncbi:MAG: Aerobic glycerol-3-phosphate dehydrogenase [Steroidobacteraceae bacterium]|nr:Aerobic glycerol-3-phosphate dehydrogenase [Steroidobacteraceae bacterium]